MALDLTAVLEAPEDVILPSGRTIPVRPLDMGAVKLYRRVHLNPDDEEAALALLRRILPGITDEEVDDLTPRMITAVIALAAGGVETMYAALEALEGNGLRAGLASPPSAPSTKKRTSSPPSRSGSGSRRATSRAGRTRKRSTGTTSS